MVEVAYYNKGEASLEKTPQAYDNFTYDNQSDGGILDLFVQVKQKIGEIKKDINTLGGDYNTLVRKYERFSNYENVMKKIINTMNGNVDTIQKCFENVANTASQAVNEHMSTDSTLMGDLDRLNQLLSQGSSNN